MGNFPGLEGMSADVLVNDIPLNKLDSPIIEPINYLKKKVVSDLGEDPETCDLRDIKHYFIKYVPASSGKHFALRLVAEADFARDCHHLGVKWRVDGLESGIRHQQPSRPAAQWNVKCDSINTGGPRTGYFKQRFKFGKLKTVDGSGDYTESWINRIAMETENFGVLRILVFQMQQSTVKTNNYQGRGVEKATIDTLPEKALKGRNITHKAVVESQEIEYGPPPRRNNVFKHPRGLPLVVFEFRYRSIEGLIRDRVIPRPLPSPSINKMSANEISLFRPRLAPGPRSSGTFLARSKSLLKPKKLPPAMRRARYLQLAEGPQTLPAKRFKESLRADGNVLIDLGDDDSDEESAIMSKAKRVRLTSDNRTSDAERNRNAPVTDKKDPHDVPFASANPRSNARDGEIREFDKGIPAEVEEDQGWDSDKTMF
ncbi:hypothetical protein TruAng_006159 [Truncatella angustata]|nr:hypothetical protein TruAng_006159 [Truncatella angustata]